MKQRFSLFLLIILHSLNLTAQDKFSVNGYIKWLGSFNYFNQDLLPPQSGLNIPARFQDYQFHNRLDFRYQANENWELGFGMRNRFFWGYQVSLGAPFQQSLELDPGLVDLSFIYWKSDQAIMHTIFDRLWLQWETQRWRVRLGRQRINWGMNTVWNPNDLLNQYNFFDFDYEERPGNDALRVQFFPNYHSQWELALAPDQKLEQSIAALRYRNNRFAYDFQFFTAYYRQDLALGGGWAGSIGGFGFKGELSYYQALTNATTSTLLFSPSLDYIFGSGWYWQLSYLFNQSADNQANTGAFFDLNQGAILSPRNLFPFRHTLFLMSSYPVSPLFNLSINLMAGPKGDFFIFYPSLSYNLFTDLDLLLAAQVFSTESPSPPEELAWLNTALFLRLKYSF